MLISGVRSAWQLINNGAIGLELGPKKGTAILPALQVYTVAPRVRIIFTRNADCTTIVTQR